MGEGVEEQKAAGSLERGAEGAVALVVSVAVADGGQQGGTIGSGGRAVDDFVAIICKEGQCKQGCQRLHLSLTNDMDGRGPEQPRGQEHDDMHLDDKDALANLDHD